MSNNSGHSRAGQSKGHSNGHSKMDTLLKVVLIAVLSVLSFSIGAFVGKQVSDTEYRQALLESEFGSDRQVASVNPKSVTHKPKNALSDDDITSLTDEFVNVEKKKIEDAKKEFPENKSDTEEINIESNESSNGYKKMSAQFAKNEEIQLEPLHETPTEKSNTKTETVKVGMDVNPAAKRVAMGQTPTPEAPKLRAPTSVLPTNPTSSVGRYTIQIASYATEQEAKTHAENLKTKGYESFYVSASVNGKDWYRVSVGLFPDHKSAMVYREENLKDPSLKSSIVQKIIR